MIDYWSFINLVIFRNSYLISFPYGQCMDWTTTPDQCHDSEDSNSTIPNLCSGYQTCRCTFLPNPNHKPTHPFKYLSSQTQPYTNLPIQISTFPIPTIYQPTHSNIYLPNPNHIPTYLFKYLPSQTQPYTSLPIQISTFPTINLPTNIPTYY